MIVVTVGRHSLLKVTDSFIQYMLEVRIIAGVRLAIGYSTILLAAIISSNSCNLAEVSFAILNSSCMMMMMMMTACAVLYWTHLFLKVYPCGMIYLYLEIEKLALRVA